MRDVHRDRDRRLERERRDAAPPKSRPPPAPQQPPRTSPGAPAASGNEAAASSATNAPSRLSSEREATRPFGKLDGLAGDHRRRRRGRTSVRASSPSFAPMSMCSSSSIGQLRICTPAHPLARALDDPRQRALARQDLDPLAAQDLARPPTHAAEEHEPAVVDVRDDQPDLVDVTDDREQRPAASPPNARDRRSERVARHVREPRGRLAPDGGGRALVPGRPGRSEQRAEDGRHRHAASLPLTLARTVPTLRSMTPTPRTWWAWRTKRGGSLR
jgi:hypothetical protein